MDEKQKFNVGDNVYYVNNNRIESGIITGVNIKMSGINKRIYYEYFVNFRSMEEEDIFTSKSEIIRRAIYKTLNSFNIESEKVEFLCKTLFPEEYEENSNELTDEDFEKLEKQEEPLQIEEKTSFWNGLFK